MLPEHIHCEDCGAHRLTKYKNTKYCHVCRLLRNLKFIGQKTKTCFICDAEFAPIDRNDGMCRACGDLRRSYNVDGKCGLCGREGLLWRKEIRVCIECLRDPRQRPRLLKGLIAKQRAQAAS